MVFVVVFGFDSVKEPNVTVVVVVAVVLVVVVVVVVVTIELGFIGTVVRHEDEKGLSKVGKEL